MPTVVAIAVVRRGREYLVGIRPAGVALAGYAEFPGGKLQPGETPAAAAVRECLEESGLDVEVIGELLRTTHQYEHGLLEIHFFDCHPIDNAQMPNAPFRWTPQAELSTLQFPEANAALTKVLAEM